MAMYPDDQTLATSGDPRVAQAIHCFDESATAEKKRRKKALECTKFYLGEQWPSNIKQDREMDGRPCLTLNRIPEFVAQVENEQRQQRPEIRIGSATEGDEAKETAEVLEDYVRHIQRRSNASVAYDTAFKCGLIGGYGYVRVNTRYANEDNDTLGPDDFDQDIYIDEVFEPNSVYMDPASIAYDAADARYCIIAIDMPREAYKAAYPKSEVASGERFRGAGEGVSAEWIRKDTVRVAEYFYIEEERIEICKVAGPDGEPVVMQVKEVPAGVAITERRFKDIKRVKWLKTNGVEVLDERDVLGSRIPVFPVYADRISVGGETALVGMVENAIQPAQMGNYWATNATETIALAPRAPYIGAEGQFQGYERQWMTANVRNYPYLQYKPTTAGGQLAPPPQRQQYEPPIQGMVQMFAMMDSALKSSMRIYNAGLGDSGPEKSGRAILAQKAQSNIANLNFADNLAYTIQSIGKYIVEIIPKVISKPRLVRALAMDGADRMVWLNKPFRKGAVDKVYDVTTGKFYVQVYSGPSYETKRQEAAAAQIEMAKVYPPMMEAAGDIVIANMDWPQADKVAERVKKTMPAALQDNPDGEKIPPQVAAQMAQMQQENQALTAALEESSAHIESDKAKIDSQERIAAMNNEVKLLIAQMQSEHQASMALLQAEMAATKHKLDLMQQADARDESREMQAAQMQTEAAAQTAQESEKE